MKGRVIAIGILSFILMCIFIFMAVYVFTDGIYKENSIYVPSERTIYAVGGPYQDALHAFKYALWFSVSVWLASMILGIIHILEKDDAAREINATIGWLAIFLAPFNWIVCICALVKFARIKKGKDSPKSFQNIEAKKKNSSNKLEIRNILMGAMSIIAMICLILYIVWLTNVEGRRFIAPVPWTHEWQIKNDIRGTNEEAAIAELCIGLGAWVISIIIGIIHLSKEMEVQKGLNKIVGIMAIAFAPVNWIICIITIIKMKKERANI